MCNRRLYVSGSKKSLNEIPAVISCGCLRTSLPATADCNAWPCSKRQECRNSKKAIQIFRKLLIDRDAGNTSEMLDEIALEPFAVIHLYVHDAELTLAPGHRDGPDGAVGVPGSLDIGEGECTVNDILIHFKISRTLNTDEMQRSTWNFEANRAFESNIDVVEEPEEHLLEEGFQGGGNLFNRWLFLVMGKAIGWWEFFENDLEFRGTADPARGFCLFLPFSLRQNVTFCREVDRNISGNARDLDAFFGAE